MLAPPESVGSLAVAVAVVQCHEVGVKFPRRAAPLVADLLGLGLLGLGLLLGWQLVGLGWCRWLDGRWLWSLILRGLLGLGRCRWRGRLCYLRRLRCLGLLLGCYVQPCNLQRYRNLSQAPCSHHVRTCPQWRHAVLDRPSLRRLAAAEETAIIAS